MLQCEPPYPGVSKPPPEPPKPLKVSQGPSRASPPCVSKRKRRSTPKDALKGHKGVKISVRSPFEHFFVTLRAGRPGKTFLRLFGGVRGSGMLRLLYMADHIANLMSLNISQPNSITVSPHMWTRNLVQRFASCPPMPPPPPQTPPQKKKK